MSACFALSELLRRARHASQRFGLVHVVCASSLLFACAESDGSVSDGPKYGNAGSGNGGNSNGGSGDAGGSENTGGFAGSAGDAGSGGSGAELNGGAGGDTSGGAGGSGAGAVGGSGAGGAGGTSGGAGGSGAGGAGGTSGGAGGSGGNPTADSCPGDTIVLQPSGGSYVGQVTGDIQDFTSGDSASCSSAGRDAVYAVVVPVAGTATISLTSAFNASLYARNSCAASEVFCRNQVGAGGVETFTSNVAQGTTYYVFVDSVVAGGSGAFTLDIRVDPISDDEACPGQAVAWTGSGSAVRTASVSGSTASATADEAGSCNGSGGSSKDLVYAFTADVDGRLLFSLDPASNYDAVLYVRSGTCDGTQLVCVDGPAAGGVESVELWAASGTTYYVFVDGYKGSSGAFVLDADLEPRQYRESCAGEPGAWSGAGPYAWSTTGDTRLRVNDHTAACASTARDAVFALTAPASGLFEATLVPGSGYDAALYVGTTCGGSNVACEDRAGSAGTEKVAFEATAGTTYYLVVDGYAASAAGTYSLSATLTEPPAYDSCPGVDLVFTGNAATTTGSTKAPAHASNTGSCGKTSSSGDAVFHFVAPQSGSATLRVVPSGSAYDPVLYVRSGDCSSGPELGCRDGGTPGGNETLTVTTTQGADYWVFVDGYQGSSGDFSLSVSY